MLRNVIHDFVSFVDLGPASNLAGRQIEYLVFESANDRPISELIVDGSNRRQGHHDAKLEETRASTLLNSRVFAPLRISIITDADRVI
jgi:hypothetical protein